MLYPHGCICVCLQVYPIADDPPSTSQWAAGAPAAQRLAALDDVMRDVQNLAAKFRCDETAAIQQAMRWCGSAWLRMQDAPACMRARIHAGMFMHACQVPLSACVCT